MATSDSPLTIQASKNLSLLLNGLPGAPSFTTAKDETSITGTITDANGAVSFESRVDYGAWVSGLTVSGLTGGNTYQYQVRGLDAEGNPGAASPAVAITTDPAAGLPLIFTDDFETGDLSKTQNGASWGASEATAVTANQPQAGTRSLEFTYNIRGDGDAWSEQRFNLGAVYKEIEVEFDFYVPDGTEGYGAQAYDHGNTAPENNKLFRLWGSTAGDTGVNSYESTEKVGFSFYYRSGGGSRLVAEWNSGSGMGPQPPNHVFTDFITPADRGSWVTIRLHFKMPTNVGAADGFLRGYKNDALVVDNVLDNYSPDGTVDHGWQHGYLLGWQNAPQAGGNILHVDNITFRGVLK